MDVKHINPTPLAWFWQDMMYFTNHSNLSLYCRHSTKEEKEKQYILCPRPQYEKSVLKACPLGINKHFINQTKIQIKTHDHKYELWTTWGGKNKRTKQKERKKYIKTNGHKHNHDYENSVSCKIHDVLDKMATLIHIGYLWIIKASITNKITEESVTHIAFGFEMSKKSVVWGCNLTYVPLGRVAFFTRTKSPSCKSIFSIIWIRTGKRNKQHPYDEYKNI